MRRQVVVKQLGSVIAVFELAVGDRSVNPVADLSEAQIDIRKDIGVDLTG